MDAIDELSVEMLAEVKQLDAEHLRRDFGLYDRRWCGLPAVGIPYRDATGAHLHEKVRLADGTMRYDPSGTKPSLYGIERLGRVAPGSTVWLVEGESDVWAATLRGLKAVGVPGASSWRPEWATNLADFSCVLIEEPDRGGAQLVQAIAWSLPYALTVRGTASTKDMCELHRTHGDSFGAALSEWMTKAVPIRSRALALSLECPAVGLHPRPLFHAQKTHHRSALDADLAKARSRPIEGILRAEGCRTLGRGKERAMLCPFHADRRHPSMSVNVERNLWHCHTCHAGGDTIGFVMRVRGLSFRAAVEELAS